ncbi:uncharacterized protein LOC113874707 [Abrus precatorius]|uniref:Uncharacterized protein LOC113874707 n=1 Tax=Abrus precatorius TaxID=3816 RepID=A0A8B8MLE1_ABRPR|nr:uncharacterized protein LOC113874707 [Abrus precatorius]
MDNLSDDILVEIWSRVPCKMAVRCKSISKRFLALISRAEFMKRSIYHHHTLLQQMKEEDHEKEWYFNHVSMLKLLIMFSPNIHLFNPQNHDKNQLSLTFINPKFNPELDDVTKRKKSVRYSRITACSNGLLLCKKTVCGRVYFVCNPVTKKWTKLPLPPPPLTGHNKRDRMSEGFVCEPYYNVEENKITFNRHRFRVVRIPLFEGTLSEFLRGITKFEIKVVVFSSETGQWSTKLVSCPKGFMQATLLLPAVALEGKLYFMGRKSLMVYDPFNNDEECYTIDYPCHLCHNPTYILIVVMLEWRLVHMINLPHQNVGSCIRPDLRVGAATYDVIGMGCRVRAFHPYDGDVVFFQYAHRIFVGNLKTKHFETVGYGIHGFQALQIISLDLPCWPTPIPSVDFE